MDIDRAELAAVHETEWRPSCGLGLCKHPIIEDGLVEVLVIVGGREHVVPVHLCAGHFQLVQTQSLIGLTL